MTESNADTRRYNAIKNRLALGEPVLVLTVFAVIQASGLSAYLRTLSSGVSSFWYVHVAVYATLFGVFYYALTFFPNFYRTYVIEHRFNLSNQNLSGWIKDEVKRSMLSLILFLVFIEFLYLCLRNSPDRWWLYMALAWILITIVITKIAPVVIIPLFFKFEPLNDLDLKDRLVRLAQRCSVKILDVFKISLSEKTKKANAALVGMGKTRRVLLGDTLLQNYSKDEIEVVLAHELAHHKLLHIWRLTLFGALSTLAAFYLVKMLSLSISGILGVETLADVTAFPSIMFAISLFGALVSPLHNTYSRSLENKADLFALNATGLPGAFISCMNKLARQNLSDPSPNRFIEFMLYDHPPISKRVKIAEDFSTATKKQ